MIYIISPHHIFPNVKKNILEKRGSSVKILNTNQNSEEESRLRYERISNLNLSTKNFGWSSLAVFSENNLVNNYKKVDFKI